MSESTKRQDSKVEKAQDTLAQRFGVTLAFEGMTGEQALAAALAAAREQRRARESAMRHAGSMLR